MTAYHLRTPVVLIIFNRPKTTMRVFEAIRQAQPSQLFILADGPRLDCPDDLEKCTAARKIVDNIDWQCQVIKNYSDVNLGCGKFVSQGISQVFTEVEQAIILEDDCLPNPTFFQFCQELLWQYEKEEKVMMISGTNHLYTWQENLQSYHFSYYGTNWGWASWRRAWNFYDYELKLWGNPATYFKLKQVLKDAKQIEHRLKLCQQVFEKKVDTWDYQWTFARLVQGGLSIIPSVNLVKNIGLGKEATHTTNFSIFDATLDYYSLDFPLKSPQNLRVDQEYDRQYFLMRTGKPELSTVESLATKLLSKGRKIQALLLLEQALKLYPNSSEIYYYQAIALEQLGQTKRAITILKFLLNLIPKHLEAEQLLSKLQEKF